MRFFEAHEDPTFRIDPNREEGIPSIGGRFSLFIIVKTATYPALPDSFAVRFGDAIHNYRCALDHLAWQLVKHGATPNPSRENSVQFPICSTESDFRIKEKIRLPGVTREKIDFIRGLHAYKRGKATNEALLSLASLSNDDKHRSIRPALSAFKDFKHEMRFTDCKPVEFAGPSSAPELKPDAVIARLTCLMTGPDPHVHMDLTPSLYIVLDDGRPMFEVLYGIRKEVEAVLHAPEILSAF